MYHYGDETMSFADAILILNTRITKADVSEDVYVAIKSLLKELPTEFEKAKNNGYIKGYIAAEKEKDKLIEKLMGKILAKEEYSKKSNIATSEEDLDLDLDK